MPLPTTEEFLLSEGRRRQYVRDEDTFTTAYLRRTQRMIPLWADGSLIAPLLRTIDVGNIEVDEDRRGEGNFSAFLRKLVFHPATEGYSIYVENVLGGDPERHFHLADYFDSLVQRKETWDEDGIWLPQHGEPWVMEMSPSYVYFRPDSIVKPYMP